MAGLKPTPSRALRPRYTGPSLLQRLERAPSEQSPREILGHVRAWMRDIKQSLQSEGRFTDAVVVQVLLDMTE